MDPLEYETMYHAESGHWWYQGMETITRFLIERRIHPAGPLRILDAGCGTGAAMTTYLADYGEVTGVDIHPQALVFCRQRKASRLARASVLDLPFASGSFDLVTSFDVLYEQAVMSDLSSMREFGRVMRDAGWLLLRLPAYNWLRGRHDQRVHTRRRYTARQVQDLMEQAGFCVEHLSYANTFLFPLAVLKRLGERLFPASEIDSDLNLQTNIFAPMFRSVLVREAPWVAERGFPFGLSVLAVGRKRPL